MSQKCPVGIDDYYTLVSDNFLYVDKTLSIKSILDNDSEVIVATRPRRFGKTLFMSMLRHFFADTVYARPTAQLFSDCLLTKQHPQFIQQHQGQYSVIYLTLKSVKPSNLEEAMQSIKGLMSQLFLEHDNLLSCDQLKIEEKATIKRFQSREAYQDEYENALLLLTKYLAKAYQKSVIILIDEYDTPIQSAYLEGFYPEFIKFMRKFFGQSLKENTLMAKALITGITRVAKESLFSDLNNITIHTVLDEGFSDCFGFTEQEMQGLLQQSNHSKLSKDIKTWYNGYQIGNDTLYNPWSIINCLYYNGKLKPYWVNTSSSSLLITTLAKATDTAKTQLEQLINGQRIDVEVDRFTHFDRLETNDTALWNLLLCSGYLTATEVNEQGFNSQCKLKIPNQEIDYLYRGIISTWVNQYLGTRPYNDLLNALITGHIDFFTLALKKFLRQSASYFDPGGENPEKFYHGLILGMMVSLQPTHQVLSNREAGFGRYDIAIIPHDTNKHPLAVILEFKSYLAEKQSLKQLAEEALQQIQVNYYEDALTQVDIKQKILIGLAFKGKQVEVAYQHK